MYSRQKKRLFFENPVQVDAAVRKIDDRQDKLPDRENDYPGPHSIPMGTGSGHLPMAVRHSGKGFHVDENLMKRIAIAILVLSSYCWAQNPDGFEPAVHQCVGRGLSPRGTPAAEPNSE